MNLLGALTFATPLALSALLLLPVIWWLLRFTRPASPMWRWKRISDASGRPASAAS